MRPCAASHCAMARVSSGVKPLAMRFISVASRPPERNASMAVSISSAERFFKDGNSVSPAPWHPRQADAPGGDCETSGGSARAGPQRQKRSAASAPPVVVAKRNVFRSFMDQALRRSKFFNGTSRRRLPVAAKMALSTAGAATKIVGSPTPPQNPPDGTG